MADENDNQEKSKWDELFDRLKENGLDEPTIDEVMDIVEDVVEEEITHNEEVRIIKIKAQTIVQVLEKVMSFITGDNVKSIIEKWGERKKELIDAETNKEVSIKHKELENLQDARKFLINRYWQDILLVSVVLIAIGVLSLTQNIEKQVTGTLVAAIIGYSLGRFKNRPQDN